MLSNTNFPSQSCSLDISSARNSNSVHRNPKHSSTQQCLPMQLCDEVLQSHHAGIPDAHGSLEEHTRRRISSVVRSSLLGDKSTPSSGMQYRHLKLQRSVKEILR